MIFGDNRHRGNHVMDNFGKTTTIRLALRHGGDPEAESPKGYGNVVFIDGHAESVHQNKISSARITTWGNPFPKSFIVKKFDGSMAPCK